MIHLACDHPHTRRVNSTPMAFPAIFIDRDGVVIENRPAYVRAWADVSLFPQAARALAEVTLSPYKIVLVTNQSAIGRGLISLETANQINAGILDLIHAQGGRIDAVYMCPHQPADACACRKPKPGLLLRARDELELDLEHSIMIGDALSDVQTGQAAGVRTNVLLLTGRGVDQAANPEAAQMPPFLTFADLHQALTALVLQ